MKKIFLGYINYRHSRRESHLYTIMNILRSKIFIRYAGFIILFLGLVGFFILVRGEITGFSIFKNLENKAVIFHNITDSEYTLIQKENLEYTSNNSVFNEYDENKELEFLSVKEENHVLNISYIFDNSNFIGSDIVVKIWVENSEGIEIEKIHDVFPINKDGLIERNVLIDVSEQKNGVYNIYLALSSDLENSVKQSVVLGKSVSTGMAVFTDKSKRLSYIVFLLMIGIGVFFIVKSHRKSVQEMHENENF